MSFVDKITAQLPFNKPSVTPEYFFALNIGLSEVTALVWQILEGKLEIISQTTLNYSGTEEFVDKGYQALDKALGALEIEPQKVLFGIPDAWSQDEDLKEPYLKLLRQLLKMADLAPMAYVLTTNALSFFLQKSEGTPPTTILLGIGSYLESTLVRGGKVIESRVVEHQGELFDDVEKALGHFHDSEVLPSKILLYARKDGVDLTKTRDQLMSFPWMQKLSFLHFPKIEILGEGISSQAIIAAAAAEISPEVDLKHSFTAPVLSTSEKRLVHDADASLIDEQVPAFGSKQSSPLDETKVSPSDEHSSPLDESDELGFVKGDIKARKPEESDEANTSVEPEESDILDSDISGNDLEDDNLVSPDLPEEEIYPPHRRSLSTLEAKVGREVEGMEEAVGLPAAAGRVQKLVAGILVKLHLPKALSGSKFTGKIALGVIILAGLVGGYLYFAKATVTIYVEPRSLEKDAQVIADPSATAIDEANKIIPGTVVQTSVTGTGTTSASGQKQIGDPAKGNIVVYNLTSNKVSLSSGTTLTSGSGLKFTLGSAVQIASQSSTIGADYTQVTTPGKSDATGVTAVAIGPDSNLAAATELSVSGYDKSQIVARVFDALSGGTSKTVTVVTADDQKKLKAQVLDDLKQKAATDLQGKETSGKKIIADALQAVDGQYTYSKKVGDQASDFSLNATVQFKGVSYSDADLRTIVSQLVATDVPSGYTLDLSSADTQADVVNIDSSGKLIFGAKFKANLIPKLDENVLKKQMAGKSTASAVNELQGMNGILSAEVKISPSILAPIGRLPFLARNITIVVTSK